MGSWKQAGGLGLALIVALPAVAQDGVAQLHGFGEGVAAAMAASAPARRTQVRQGQNPDSGAELAEPAVWFH